MGLLKADVEHMLALGEVLDDAGAQIDAIEIRSAVSDISAALPGCSIPQACAKAGESTEYAWLKVADRLRTVAYIVTSAAKDIDATDRGVHDMLATLAFDDKP
ncbi:hypothetical protein [Millisia brevis]|uniref:hypothetical protein n=1 Tax=Millisia brevis TaxID=264148 RepID=UPI0012EDB47E|nr:hypothetical protein [Millisia brevis]